MAPEELVQLVMDSGLRGRGGAGFGTGQKWSFLPKDVFPRYLAVNGDEGEPSTFKDHMLVERDPHQLIEGIVITAYAIQAHHAFIYLRGEFALGAERLGLALADAYDARLRRQEHPRLRLRPRDRAAPRRRLLHRRRRDRPAVEPRGRARHAAHQAAVPRGAGRVRRADDRQQRRDAVDRPAHRAQRSPSGTPTRREPLQGHAPLLGVGDGRANPGNYEVELGMTFRELIDDLAGGIRDGRDLGFFIPGGASAPWLLERHLDVPLDMDYVQPSSTPRPCSGRAR